MKKTATIIAINLVMIAAAVGLFEYAARATGMASEEVFPSMREQRGRNRYPQHYFKPHPERGHAIKENMSNLVLSSGQGYYWEIFSNSIGCFDKNTHFSDNYTLVLGDSFTWGYGYYDEKWGTVFERDTGIDTAKCGVTHTGQFFQTNKFKEVIQRVGKPPKLVLVGWHGNDVKDDFLYPRATVVNGWMLSKKRLDDDGFVFERSEFELHSLYSDWINNQNNKLSPNLFDKSLTWLRFNSVTANMIDTGLTRLHRWWASKTTDRKDQFTYIVPEDTSDNYRNNPNTKPNRTAILELKDAADKVGAKLVFAIIPARRNILTFRQNYFADLEKFFEENGIEYINLATIMRRYSDKEVVGFYADGAYPHFSKEGEILLAESLIDKVARKKLHPDIRPPENYLVFKPAPEANNPTDEAMK